MKKYKKQLKHLVLIIFAVLVTGCSWFSDSTEPVNESYESGKKALEEGNYEIAKSYFREISPDSPFYPQAIWMIQKVPFKKGVAAFEQKQYQIAIFELSRGSTSLSRLCRIPAIFEAGESCPAEQTVSECFRSRSFCAGPGNHRYCI